MYHIIDYPNRFSCDKKSLKLMINMSIASSPFSAKSQIRSGFCSTWRFTVLRSSWPYCWTRVKQMTHPALGKLHPRWSPTLLSLLLGKLALSIQTLWEVTYPFYVLHHPPATLPKKVRLDPWGRIYLFAKGVHFSTGWSTTGDGFTWFSLWSLHSEGISQGATFDDHIKILMFDTTV